MNGEIFSVYKKYIGIFFLIFFISVIVGPFFYKIINADEVIQREKNLNLQFESIVQPAVANQLDLRIRSKTVNRWLVAEYKYDNMTDEEVEKYYEEELMKEGWSKKSVINKPNKRFRTSVYKKEMYEISIEPYKDYWVIIINYRDFFDKHGL